MGMDKGLTMPKTAASAKTRYGRYTGRHFSQISFPLGGIGSGCVGLGNNKGPLE